MKLELTHLLCVHAFIFNTPTTLPPPCFHHHHIPLIKGAMPIKVKTYCYPHSQKTKIEKLLVDMLQEGIIQPSKSPFSSPITLVKKKD